MNLMGNSRVPPSAPASPLPLAPPMQPHLFELRIIIAFAIWMEIFGWEIYG